MALFVVRHQHAADRCPSQNPYVGAELLIHCSRPSAKKHGVRIQGEAVIQNEHTFYLIAEAADETGLRAFLQPFQMAGSLEIYAASTFAHVVTSGGCASSIPASELAAALDPEKACRQAIDAGLVVHRAHPLNCETSLPALVGGVVMPNARFYVRNHFQIPLLDEAAFRLNVSGLVERPLALSVRDLHNMRSHTLVATLECAGNGRTLFERPTPGEKWTLGAVSTAEWTGVPLVEVLDRAGVRSLALPAISRACALRFRARRAESNERTVLRSPEQPHAHAHHTGRASERHRHLGQRGAHHFFEQAKSRGHFVAPVVRISRVGQQLVGGRQIDPIASADLQRALERVAVEPDSGRHRRHEGPEVVGRLIRWVRQIPCDRAEGGREAGRQRRGCGRTAG
jgi:hypothetical protein